MYPKILGDRKELQWMIDHFRLESEVFWKNYDSIRSDINIQNVSFVQFNYNDLGDVEKREKILAEIGEVPLITRERWYRYLSAMWGKVPATSHKGKLSAKRRHELIISEEFADIICEELADIIVKEHLEGTSMYSGR
jgi:hypothetical protein